MIYLSIPQKLVVWRLFRGYWQGTGCIWQWVLRRHQPLFNKMPCDDEEAAIPKPAIAKEVVAEIALEHQEEKSEFNGRSHMKKKIAAPLRMLAVKKPNTSKIE